MQESCVIFLSLVNRFHVLFFSGEQFEKVTKKQPMILWKIASFAGKPSETMDDLWIADLHRSAYNKTQDSRAALREGNFASLAAFPDTGSRPGRKAAKNTNASKYQEDIDLWKTWSLVVAF